VLTFVTGKYFVDPDVIWQNLADAIDHALRHDFFWCEKYMATNIATEMMKRLLVNENDQEVFSLKQ